MITKIDTDKDFFEMYPNLKVPFSDIRHRLKKPEQTSKMMWAISLVYHPISEYYNMPVYKRRSQIKEKFLKANDRFSWDNYAKDIEIFKEFALTKEERFLTIWDDKLDEWGDYMASLSPKNSKEEADQLKDAMLAADKIFKSHQQIKENYRKAKEQSKTQGDAEESLVEKALI